MRNLLTLKVSTVDAKEALKRLLTEGNNLLEVNTLEYRNGVLSSENVAKNSKALRHDTEQWATRARSVLSEIFESPLSVELYAPMGVYPNLAGLHQILSSLHNPNPSFRKRKKPDLALTGIKVLHPKVEKYCSQSLSAGRFDSAVFEAFKVLESELRRKAKAKPEDIGTALITKVMSPAKPILLFSDVAAEREAFHSLFRGALGAFKNPHSHRFIELKKEECLEMLSFVSLLLRLLKDAKVV